MEWKYIKEYDKRYIINEYGDIISLNYNKTNNPKQLSANENSNGYLTVSLCKNGISKSYFVHRLVAENFIENKNNLPCVNHLDCNRKNNYYKNLSWCTTKENTNYNPTKEKQKINGKRISKNKEKKVYQYNLDGELIKIWDCVCDIPKEIKLSKGTLINHLNNKYKTKEYHNFIWSYNLI